MDEGSDRRWEEAATRGRRDEASLLTETERERERREERKTPLVGVGPVGNLVRTGGVPTPVGQKFGSMGK